MKLGHCPLFDAKDVKNVFGDNDVFIFLDYDGTLAPIVTNYRDADMLGGNRTLIEKLNAIPGVKVAIVSGRALRDVKKRVGIKNPRRRDGKDLHYIDASVQTVIWPTSKINFIEVLPAGEDEEIISQVRD